ncbi:cyclin-like protein interacting with PHO85 [Coemansia sp. RSA 2599]|nr:cyclin-like protein interacting with PHO85 [Coemansia sp. RSA 2598]KAJ1825450.1 cyclin-like protein interacting with PHO85 [Coemansia sp. RSA 2599]
MALVFNLATTPVQETVRQVSAYLDAVTGCSQALALQTREPGIHERQTSLTLFHARSVPTIDLETYMTRILKYCPCQNEVFLGLVVYMQQMIDQCARRRMPFTVDAFSIHRLVITAVTVGSKWFSDVFFTNSRYAKVGGISVAELNNLELQFLSIVDFDLNIQPEVLQAIGADLFSGRLPKLTNVYRDFGLPAKLDSAFTPSQPPTATATEHHQQQYQQQQYQHQHQHQQMPPHHQYSHAAPQPHSSRPLSYPGPNGVFYSNPTPAASSIYKYRNIHDQMAPKTLVSAASRNMQSTGSTLTSSSPGDTTAISALHHGIV